MSANERAPISLCLDEQAAHNFVRLQADPDPAERESILRWIAADPRHAVAFARIEAAWEAAALLKGDAG